jgi:hypothetical protein
MNSSIRGRTPQAVAAALLLGAALLTGACGGTDAGSSDQDVMIESSKAPTDKSRARVAARTPAGKEAPVEAPSVSVTRSASAKGVARLAPGQTLTGMLEQSDAGSGPPIDWFIVDLPTPGEVMLLVQSADFNPLINLAVAGAEEAEQYMRDGPILWVEDWPAGEHQIGLVATPEAVATHMDFAPAAMTGEYTISLEFRGEKEGNHTALTGLLMENYFDMAPDRGTLADGTFYIDHPLELSAGETVTINMLSVVFDTFLLVVQNEEILASNDDGPDGTNSRLTFTAPSTGTYMVRANSYEAAQSGLYSIIIDR